MSIRQTWSKDKKAARTNVHQQTLDESLTKSFQVQIRNRIKVVCRGVRCLSRVAKRPEWMPHDRKVLGSIVASTSVCFYTCFMCMQIWVESYEKLTIYLQYSASIEHT